MLDTQIVLICTNACSVKPEAISALRSFRQCSVRIHVSSGRLLTRQQITLLNDDDDNPLPEDVCADIFDNAFASAFPRHPSSNLSSYCDLNFPLIPDIIISSSGIANIIDELEAPNVPVAYF